MRLPSKIVCRFRHLTRTYVTQARPHVAIVGSGPAGYYTAQQILKGSPHAQVDIYDKLPVPFGLVRFGVAPDHPEVKNVITTFTKTANNERCSFLGNVLVGKDLSIQDLQSAYTAVVLAYGAEEDRTLGVPGEDLKGVLSARSFVGWYNGLPENSQLQPDLDTDTAVVLGQGNVAIDVARILLTPLDKLKKTDITEYALAALSQSRISRVYLVGRRGPLQVAFTTAELREMVRLEGCRPVLDKQDFVHLQEQAKQVPQKRRRLTQLLMKTALEEPGGAAESGGAAAESGGAAAESGGAAAESGGADSPRGVQAHKQWALKFLRSPTRFLPSESGDRVGAVRFTVNKLEGENSETQRAVATPTTEDIPCGLVLRSIGYRSVYLPGVPFDDQRAVIPNQQGRVTGQTGLYCSGWIKRGPVGVIVSTMNDAFETGKVIVDDLSNGTLTNDGKEGKSVILSLLKTNGVEPVTFEQWNKIDAAEVYNGEKHGKPREKITDIARMLETSKR